MAASRFAPSQPVRKMDTVQLHHRITTPPPPNIHTDAHAIGIMCFLTLVLFYSTVNILCMYHFLKMHIFHCNQSPIVQLGYFQLLAVIKMVK